MLNPLQGVEGSVLTATNDAYSQYSASFTVGAQVKNRFLRSIRVDYAAMSIAGARQIAVRILDASSNIQGEFMAGATLSALQHRYVTFAPGALNQTAFTAVAASGDSAGYLNNDLPLYALKPGWIVRVLDLADITASDDVLVRILYSDDYTTDYTMNT